MDPKSNVKVKLTHQLDIKTISTTTGTASSATWVKLSVAVPQAAPAAVAAVTPAAAAAELAPAASAVGK